MSLRIITDLQRLDTVVEIAESNSDSVVLKISLPLFFLLLLYLEKKERDDPEDDDVTFRAWRGFFFGVPMALLSMQCFYNELFLASGCAALTGGLFLIRGHADVITTRQLCAIPKAMTNVALVKTKRCGQRILRTSLCLKVQRLFGKILDFLDRG